MHPACVVRETTPRVELVGADADMIDADDLDSLAAKEDYPACRHVMRDPYVRRQGGSVEDVAKLSERQMKDNKEST